LVHLWRNPGVPVVVGARRAETLQRFWDDLKPGVIILDDGFQHFAMARDRDILVHDFSAKDPLWRDFPGLLESADLRVSLGASPESARVPEKWTAKPWVIASYGIEGVRPVEELWRGGTALPLPKRALLFCGVGNPERVAASVRAAGCDIKATRALPDHADYSAAQLEGLRRWAQAQDSAGTLPMLTTLKDAVKLPEDAARSLGRPVLVLDARFTFHQNEALLAAVLEGL
jgi:tetraacyldisaccharide 4'-kinase